MIGATTREGMLPSPLRARFGFTAHLDFYPHEELEKLIERSSSVLGISLEEGAAHQLAMRSRGTPRIANRLLRRVRDWAIVHDLETVHPDDVKEALALYQIDTEGLDRLDIAVLKAIVTNFNGGPVGLNNLSAMVGGIGDRGNGVRAVSGPRRIPCAHPERACGDAQGMGSSRLDF